MATLDNVEDIFTNGLCALPGTLQTIAQQSLEDAATVPLGSFFVLAMNLHNAIKNIPGIRFRPDSLD
jgi:hypothetical protein